MGKIEGIAIRNFGPLKNITIGRTRKNPKEKPLGNMVTIIGPGGSGKSTFADVFGFITDCLEAGVEEACDGNCRGGYDQLISQNARSPISFEIYYRESRNTPPITYGLSIGKDRNGRPYVKEERLRQRVGVMGGRGRFSVFRMGKGMFSKGLTAMKRVKMMMEQ